MCEWTVIIILPFPYHNASHSNPSTLLTRPPQSTSNRPSLSPPGCYSLTDLMCQNHRCVPKMLRCDGFDHCGDNSDEPASCYVVGPGNKSLTPEDAAWWYQSTPNYYFPQKSNFFQGAGYGWSGVLLLASFIRE